MPDDARLHGGADAADPVEAVGVIGDTFVLEQLLHGHGLIDDGDGGPIARRLVEHEIGQHEARGTRHVLHDDRRIAWKHSPEMAGDEAAIGVIATARPCADVERDALGAEGFLILRLRARDLERCCAQQRKQAARHWVPPAIFVGRTLAEAGRGRQPALSDRPDARHVQ